MNPSRLVARLALLSIPALVAGCANKPNKVSLQALSESPAEPSTAWQTASREVNQPVEESADVRRGFPVYEHDEALTKQVARRTEVKEGAPRTETFFDYTTSRSTPVAHVRTLLLAADEKPREIASVPAEGVQSPDQVRYRIPVETFEPNWRWMEFAWVMKKKEALREALIAKAAARSLPESKTSVRKGESLSQISKRLYKDDTRWKELFVLNQERLKSPDRLAVGTEIVWYDFRADALKN